MKRIALETDVGAVTLSAPSKMPGYSWSMPAGISCPSARKTVKDYGDSAVCASCYVIDLKTGKGRGNYRFPNVVNSQQRRMDWINASIKADGGESAITGLVGMIRKATEYAADPVFRVHDSGDMYRPEYANVWHRVAQALPDVRFWIPTREYLRPVMLPSLRALAALPNVSVRPSAAVVGQDAPDVPGLSAGTAVALPDAVPAGHWICPATSTDEASCDAHGCRACWDSETSVAYMAHGAGIKRNVVAIQDAARRLPQVA